jgi:protein-disulfide isomerase
VSDLTSAAVPAVGVEDHVRGEGTEAVVYADLGCPHCAAVWLEVSSRPGAIAFRHSLYADRGHVDDPHLWERVERLGLDLERFERDRRSGEVAARVRRDFESGIRAGVSGTPAVFDIDDE